MIKRQYYNFSHNDANAASSSSSSSDSSGDEAIDDAIWPASSHESDDNLDEGATAEVQSYCLDRHDTGPEPGNDGSDIFKHKVKGSSCRKGQKISEVGQKISSQWADAVDEAEQEKIGDFDSDVVIYVGASKGVLKCRLCPKTICLSEDIMRTHLSSKRHARAMKQFEEGRLKVWLNSDGEEEEEGETHKERYMRIVEEAKAKKKGVENMKNKRKMSGGRQRQCKRAKFKATKEQKDCKVKASS